MSGIAETYGSGFLNSQNPNSQQQGDLSTGGGLANSRLAYSGDSTALYRPLADPAQQNYQPGNGGGSGGGGNVENVGSGDPVKRRRGRPRKYTPDGGVGIGLGSPPSGGLVSPPVAVHSGGLVSPPGGDSGTPVSGKRGRGRPPGSVNKPKVLSTPPALGNMGNGLVAVGFTPHVLTVKAGEDVSAKIMALSQNGPRSVCILSASGAVSNVTLNQASISGGTVTYEGRFEILSLSGSFLLSESGGQRSRTGGLSVSLAGPDGHVLGGGVAGLLIAASPVQVIVCTFTVESPKEKIHGGNSEPLNAPSKFATGASAGGSPISRGTHSESSGVPVSPLSHNSTGACNNNNMSQGIANMAWK